MQFHSPSLSRTLLFPKMFLLFLKETKILYKLINEITKRRTENYHLVITVVMKNCEPLVSGPAFAIDKKPTIKRGKGM